MTEDQRADLPALAALVFLDLVAALCLARLFTSAGAVAPMLVAVVVGHAVAFACRLRNLSGPATGAAVAVAALLATVWLVLPHETYYGFPTADTFDALSRGLSDARRDFGVAIAPAEPTQGFVIACVVAVVVLSALADWAAFRIRTTIEAAVPAFTLFVFAGVLGTAYHRGSATVAFAGALLVWFVVDNTTVIARTRPWFHGTAEAGRRAISRAGTGLGAIGLVGALLGLALPFSQDPPAVAWRNRTRNEARTTVSPLVDIRTRLVARSDVVAFTVQSPTRAYWRLTSLDVFDGDIWSSHGSYRDVDADKTLKDRPGAIATQSYSIQNLRSIWLPVAYRPASTPSINGISYDDDADAFITEQQTSDALNYSVRSAVQTFTPETLKRARPLAVSDQELAVPTNLDPRVAALATQITQGRLTPYDKAFAIQQYLRSSPFRYDLSVPAGHSNDALARFLFVSKRGYCEQFAGSYAVLARLAGLPARVAVGFTAGEYDETSGTWTVRELHAHAWPEVYLGSAGWVAFEPTPGRGIPGAEAYTGAVESQADTRRPSAASTVVPTTVAAGGNSTSPGDNTTTTATPPTTAAPKSGGSDRPFLKVLAIVALALAIIAGLTAIVPIAMTTRRRRRWAAAASPTAKVIVAWTDTDEALRFAGAAVRRSHTPTERVDSATPTLDEGGVATLTRLAERVDLAAYSNEPITDTDADAAWREAIDVRRSAFATRSRWQVFLFAIDPRRLRRR